MRTRTAVFAGSIVSVVTVALLVLIGNAGRRNVLRDHQQPIRSDFLWNVPPAISNISGWLRGKGGALGRSRRTGLASSDRSGSLHESQASRMRSSRRAGNWSSEDPP